MNETADIKDNLLKEAVGKILDDAKVPMRTHLQVLKALGERVKQHEETLSHAKADRENALKITQKHINHIETLGISHAQERIDWEEMRAHLLSIEHLEGKPGKPGKDADSIDEDAIVKSILRQIIPFIPEPIEGKPGKDAILNEKEITELVIERLKKDKPLDLSHIKGAQSFIKDGVKYKFEELMHGGGRSTGGSFSIQVPTGTVDGVNRTFVFTTAPNVVVLDNGNFMNRVSSDGTVNWTVVGSTITLNQAPLFNIYGF